MNKRSMVLSTILPVRGGMVATGVITNDPTNQFNVGDFVRTSLIQKINVKKGTITTLNTVYTLVG